MPIYEFECKSCESTTEALVTMNTETLECYVCHSTASRVMSKAVGKVIGGTPRLTSTKNPRS